MAKIETKKGEPANAGETMTLNEFCIRLSTKDRRVELIGGFEHAERVSGQLKDTGENYTVRYNEFINKPA